MAALLLSTSLREGGNRVDASGSEPQCTFTATAAAVSVQPQFHSVFTKKKVHRIWGMAYAGKCMYHFFNTHSDMPEF